MPVVLAVLVGTVFPNSTHRERVAAVVVVRFYTVFVPFGRFVAEVSIGDVRCYLGVYLTQVSVHSVSIWVPVFVVVCAFARGGVHCFGVGVVEGGPFVMAVWQDVSTFVPATFAGDPTSFMEVVIGGPGAARFLPP
jgi:hypothetical protein